MPKAIHLINGREGLTRKSLSLIKGALDTWRTCCWVLSGDDQDALLGGWVYLHDTMGKPATFAGQIIGFEEAPFEGLAAERRVAIIFKAHREGRDQKWRGASHGVAWSSGVIDADLPHEQI